MGSAVPCSRQDPSFPYLGESRRFLFPDPGESSGDIVALCGNLSPGMLLSAYEQGIFPWYGPDDPLIWQSPDPRMVIFPESLRVSRSMRKTLAGGEYEIAFNRDFRAVIRGCAEAERPGQDGTWIDGEIMEAYTRLHELGWAHSAEAYIGGRLAGGCYGILLPGRRRGGGGLRGDEDQGGQRGEKGGGGEGGLRREGGPRGDGDQGRQRGGEGGLRGAVFCGESMFAKRPNASKAAFLTFAELLFANGAAFIDCQVPTEHLRSLGGAEMSRRDFLALLRKTLGAEPV